MINAVDMLRINDNVGQMADQMMALIENPQGPQTEIAGDLAPNQLRAFLLSAQCASCSTGGFRKYF